MAERYGTNRQGNDNPKPTDPNGPQKPTRTSDKPKLNPDREAMLRKTLEDRLATYKQQFGGAAYSGQSAQATRDWADAQLASGAITQEQHDSFYASSHAMAQNFREQEKYFAGIQKLQERLGDEVSGFVPPGWDSTSAAILEGRAPVPTSSDYAGVAAWVAANPDAGANYVSRSGKIRKSEGETTAGTNEGIYRPFTAMTGTQTGVAGYPYIPYADPQEAFSAAHMALASHYASAAAAGDFDSAGKAFDALQAHQEAMAPAPVPGPESFSEKDLFDEVQYR